MKKIFYVMLISLFIMTVACEKNTTIELGELERELVITSFISPNNKTTEVNVTWSRSLFGLQKNDILFDIITYAKVEISTLDGTSVSLPFDEKNQLYSIDADRFPIISGQTYQLKVVLPDGKTATSKCTVPRKINSSLNIETIDSLKNGSYYELGIDIGWDDLINQKNYYRIHAFVDQTLVSEDATILNNFERVKFTNEFDVYDDILFENSKIILRNGFYYNYYFGDFEGEIVSKKIICYLLNTDENYYNYHNTINSNLEIDFYSEPSLIFSNIEGGIGCFGAYNSFRVEKEF